MFRGSGAYDDDDGNGEEDVRDRQLDIRDAHDAVVQSSTVVPGDSPMVTPIDPGDDERTQCDNERSARRG